MAKLNTNEIKKMNKDQITYSREEVLEAAIEYFKGDTLAGEVWMKKYALRDGEGNI